MTASTAAIPAKGSKKSKAAKTPDAPPAESPPKGLKLPETLASYHDALVRALATPIPWTWDDEGPAYLKAEQPEAIASVLVRALHHDVLNAKIAVIFRKSIKSRGKVRGAQASLVGGKLNYFSGVDLLIEVNHETWRWLTPERRIALIDHELCHFARNDDNDGYALIPHDVEEFGVMLRRWGLWEHGLERFASAVDRARQLDIFPAAVAKADASVN